MTVLMYQKRFVEPIQSGRKTHSIRGNRKRQIPIGDLLSHRIWEHKAYRSPQIEIAKGICIAVFPIEVYADGYRIGRGLLINRLTPRDEFAYSDGFDHWADMMAYYREPGGYGLPFSGVLIQWE